MVQKNHRSKSQENRYKLLIVVSLLISLVIVAFLTLAFRSQNIPNNNLNITLYAKFDCKECLEAYLVIQDKVTHYKDTVFTVEIEFIGKESVEFEKAVALLAAERQNKGNEFFSKFFLEQSQQSVFDFAESEDMDQNVFQEDLSNDELNTEIMFNLDKFVQLDLPIPSIIVNNNILNFNTIMELNTKLDKIIQD